ncbi:hypothetical protein, partial [Methylobacterium haplocladii]
EVTDPQGVRARRLELTVHPVERAGSHIIPDDVIQAVESRLAKLEGFEEPGMVPTKVVVIARAYTVRSAIPLPRHWFKADPWIELPDGSIELVFHFGLEVECTIAEEAIDRLAGSSESEQPGWRATQAVLGHGRTALGEKSLRDSRTVVH